MLLFLWRLFNRLILMFLVLKRMFINKLLLFKVLIECVDFLFKSNKLLVFSVIFLLLIILVVWFCSI